MNVIVFIKLIYVYIPFAAFVLAYFAYVRRSGYGRAGRIGWTCVLAVCSLKFVVFDLIGGDPIYPEVPGALIWIWSWAYAGMLTLCLLAVLAWRWRSCVKGPLLAVLSWSFAAYGVWEGVRVPDVREIEFSYGGLPSELDGYRIVQLSDLHVSASAKSWRTRAIVRKVNALNADLVCLTGDYVDGSVKRRLPDIKPLVDLKARDGVYLVAGNHECYHNPGEWETAYRNLGLRFLANDCVFPRPSLALAGVNDKDVFRLPGGDLFARGPDVGKAFASATNGQFRVLLQHRPECAASNMDRHGVRLQLSGHTHGGIMPVLASVVRSHNNGFLRGIYKLPRGNLFVHSGTGQWAGFPCRFFAPAEIVVITLRK